MLDVTGFEEIFAEIPVLQSSIESLVTSEDEVHPVPQHVEKPSCESSPLAVSETAKKVEQKKATSVKPAIQATPVQVSRKTELPTKQDFKMAVNERLFHKLMLRLGFTPGKQNSHPMYEKNGYRIPVPNNLQAEGTRVSIFKQATAPARNSEGKGD